jgi:hypothetical protein
MKRNNGFSLDKLSECPRREVRPTPHMLSYRLVYIQCCGTRQPLAGNRQTFRVGHRRPTKSNNANQQQRRLTPPRPTIQKSRRWKLVSSSPAWLLCCYCVDYPVGGENERRKTRTAALTLVGCRSRSPLSSTVTAGLYFGIFAMTRRSRILSLSLFVPFQHIFNF